MADPIDIAKVKDNIEDDATAYGFGEVEIVRRLDVVGQTPTRIIAVYWAKRAQNVITLVNISESGSSRGNDAIYARMSALAEKWGALADAEETEEEVATEGRARNGAIVRI